MFLPPGDGAPNKKDHDGPHGRTYETCPFTRMIPAECLAQVRSDECSYDAKERDENKPRINVSKFPMRVPPVSGLSGIEATPSVRAPTKADAPE